MSETAPARLRSALAPGRVVHAPGVYDAVTAALVREAGFEVAYLSGAAVSAVRLGLADLGYVDGGDIAAQAASLIPALQGIPLVADADTGYGNPLHARRTVEQYARAGVAGLHIEDQVSPKRCGHMAGKSVVPLEEATARVRAAVEAATGLVVIARTDALSVEGIDGAVSRATAFAAAGADLVFVEGASDLPALEAIHRAVPDVGLVFNRSEAGSRYRDLVPDERLVSAGVRLVIHPVSALLVAAHAVRGAYAEIRASAAVTGAARLDWEELSRLCGLPEALALEARYASGAR